MRSVVYTMAMIKEHQGDVITGRRINAIGSVSFYFVSKQSHYMSAVKHDFNNARWIWATTYYYERKDEHRYNFYTENYRLTCVHINPSSKTKFRGYFQVFGVSDKTPEDRLRSVKYGTRLFLDQYDFYQGEKWKIPEQKNSVAVATKIRRISSELAKFKEAYKQEQIEKNMEEIEERRNWAEELKEIIDLQDDFERQNAKNSAFQYSSFEPISTDKKKGVAYKFYIKKSNTDIDEKLIGTRLEITEDPDEETGLNGYVKDISVKENYLIIAFQDTIDFGKFPKSGTLVDRLKNITYKIQKESITNLIEGKSVNDDILNILIDGEFKKMKKGPSNYDIFIDSNNEPTQTQLEAVNLALDAEDFLLVQGPPGTGKTTIIVEMVKEFVKQGKRVLISSKNNLAVDNVLESCIKKNISCVRLGREEKVKIDIVKKRIIDHAAPRLQQDILNRCDGQQLELLNKLEEQSKFVNLLKENFDKVLSYYETCNNVKINLSKMEKRKRYMNWKSKLKKLPIKYAKFTAFFTRNKEKVVKKEEAYWSYIDEKLNEDTAYIEAKKGYEKYSDEKTLLQYQLDHNFSEINDDKEFNYKDINKNQLQERLKKEIELQRRYKNRDIILGEWKESLKERQQSLYPLLLNSVKVVGATCIGINTDVKFKDVDFDVAIIDEAGQITIFDEIVPMSRARKVILVGDHMQLPPVPNRDLIRMIQQDSIADEDSYFSDEDYNELLEKSLFELLFDTCPEDKKVMLDTQFRMHPTIAKFISDEFYNGKYVSGISAEKRELKVSIFDKPLYFIDTRSMGALRFENFVTPKGHKEYFNSTEAEIVASVLISLVRDGANPEEIGVITPYRRQKIKIEEILIESLPSQEDTNKKIEIDTVDSFQGRDKDIILFSFTRSNEENTIGFLSELRRLNVTMTRSKYLLIMIGDSQTLTNTSNYKARNCFDSFIDYVKKNNGYLTWNDIKKDLWLGGDIDE